MSGLEKVYECIDFLKKDNWLACNSYSTLNSYVRQLHLSCQNLVIEEWNSLAQHHFLDDFLMPLIDLRIKKFKSISEKSEYKDWQYSFKFLLSVINIMCLKSFELKQAMNNRTFLQASLSLITDDKYRLFADDTISWLLIDLMCMSTGAERYKQLWAEFNMFDILLDFLNKTTLSLFDKHTLYITLGNIATDQQIERAMDNFAVVISEFKIIIDSFAQQLKQGVDLSDVRDQRNFTETDETGNEVIISYPVFIVSYTQDNGTHTITTLLQCLYTYSINEKTKLTIFDNLYESLAIIVTKGYEMEQKRALDVLAQLCFNEDIVKRVSTNGQELIAFVKELSTRGNLLLIKSLPKKCNEFLFLFQTLGKSVEQKEPNNKHIMISYNTKSRQLCLQIKQELEKRGFKVWIDVENIHGSSLDAMAKAIEDSSCVLLCITEFYRQSVNCQAEAQYTFKLKKPFVPLIMQKGYGNVMGWLGIIIGDRIFIDFTKYEFSECVRRLFGEIDKFGLDYVTPPAAVTSETLNTAHDTEKWTEEEVTKWCEQHSLPINILSTFKPCTGVMLKQLFQMRRDAPEFYYQLVFKQCNEQNFGAALLFTKQLESLFK